MEAVDRRRVTELLKAIERLAMEPAGQAAYLRELGTYPSLDELALEFDDSAALVDQIAREGGLTPRQVDVVRELNDRLASAPDQDGLLQVEALATTDFWREIRTAAARFFTAH